MDEKTSWVKVASSILAVTLSAALLATSASSPPTLDVGECLTVESGTPVDVVGILVGLRSYDSGTEVLTLMDTHGGACIRVVCSPSRVVSLEATLEVAALVRAEGEVSRDAADTVIFASKARVTMLATSEYTLSVQLLCENWQLFEFDRFNVSGELVECADEAYLKGFGTNHKILVRCAPSDLLSYTGQTVVVDCTLFVDRDSPMAFLWVFGVHA